MHYWDWENWQGAALMVGHQATTDFPYAGGNWQSAASMESRSNSKLFTSMQCSNTPKKATTASCSVVWVAKFNGPLRPPALIIWKLVYIDLLDPPLPFQALEARVCFTDYHQPRSNILFIIIISENKVLCRGMDPKVSMYQFLLLLIELIARWSEWGGSVMRIQKRIKRRNTMVIMLEQVSSFCRACWHKFFCLVTCFCIWNPSLSLCFHLPAYSEQGARVSHLSRVISQRRQGLSHGGRSQWHALLFIDWDACYHSSRIYDALSGPSPEFVLPSSAIHQRHPPITASLFRVMII